MHPKTSSEPLPGSSQYLSPRYRSLSRSLLTLVRAIGTKHLNRSLSRSLLTLVRTSGMPVSFTSTLVFLAPIYIASFISYQVSSISYQVYFISLLGLF